MKFDQMITALVTGSRGMLGRHISSALQSQGYKIFEHDRTISDLCDYESTKLVFKTVKPDLVIHCAALVGGIKANLEGGDSFYSVNRQIDSNIFQICMEMKLERLVFIGSSCMYPINKGGTLRVEDLGRGQLEPSNESYAIAKLESVQQLKDIASSSGLAWKTYVASNLYGPFDNFNPDTSHLIPAIIRKVIVADEQGRDSVEMWGDGSPRREFTYAPEFASWLVASVPIMEKFPTVLNVGLGEDFTVQEYYEMVINLINPKMRIVKNESIPNGIASKLMDSSIAYGYGWEPKIKPLKGIRLTVDWFRQNRVVL